MNQKLTLENTAGQKLTLDINYSETTGLSIQWSSADGTGEFDDPYGLAATVDAWVVGFTKMVEQKYPKAKVD